MQHQPPDFVDQHFLVSHACGISWVVAAAAAGKGRISDGSRSSYSRGHGPLDFCIVRCVLKVPHRKL